MHGGHKTCLKQWCSLHKLPLASRGLRTGHLRFSWLLWWSQSIGEGVRQVLRGTLMVVSSEPEKTRLEEAARARTAPLCPVSVARHFSVFTSQTRTCHISGQNFITWLRY